jgi:hypothetical protein
VAGGRRESLAGLEDEGDLGGLTPALFGVRLDQRQVIADAVNQAFGRMRLRRLHRRPDVYHAEVGWPEITR